MRLLFSFFLIIAILCCLPFISGCNKQISPRTAMDIFATRYPLPAGRFYHSEADIYDETYLSDDAFCLLFARQDGDTDREDIQSFALFFGTSLTQVNEAGVFLCPDRDAAFEVVGMLRGRLDVIRRMNKADISHTEDAVITLYGKTVVYLVLPDNPAAARTMSHILT